MRTLNIPPLTPAQRAINELVTGGTEFSLTEKAIYNRVTEIASDVRALAATVAELQWHFHNANDVIDRRLAALESPGSAEAAPAPVCTVCGHEKCHHIGFGAFCAANHCACRGYYTVPAEAAPEPVCKCGFPYDEKCMRRDCPGAVSECANCGHRLVDGSCVNCSYVPAEQAFQEPPALDPVLVAIRTLYVLVTTEPKVGLTLDSLSSELRHRWRRITKSGLREYEVDAAIRAYGGDAREGGK